MASIDFDSPDNAPAWLDQWMTDQQVQALFPQRIRTMSMRVLLQENTLRLDWGKRTLHATIGNQICTWRRDDSGTWVPRCSCHYADGRCIHAFAAHIMFLGVCRKKGWQTPLAAAGTPSPAPAPPPQTGNPFFPSPPAAVPPSRPIAFPQKSFSRVSPPTASSLHRPPPFPRTPPLSKLLVELDFSTEQYVGARFYIEQNGERRLLHLSWIRNYAYEIVQENPRMAPSVRWPDEDKALLKEIYPSLHRLDFSALHMNTLHLSFADTRSWLEKWKETPGRFYNRATQQPIRISAIPAFSSLQFELNSVGPHIHVSAVLLTADGQRLHIHQLFQKLRDDPLRFLLQDAAARFATPVPWETLRRYFATYPTALLPGEVARRLPLMLHGRIDLLVPGKLVQHMTSRETPLAIHLQTDDSGAFEIAVTAGRISLAPGSLLAGPVSFLLEAHGAWQVCSLAEERLAGIRTSLRTLLEKCGVAVLEQQQRLRLLATTATAQLLHDFWEKLPASLGKHCTPQLEGILQERPVRPILQLEVREQSGIVQLSQQTRLGQCRLSQEEIHSIISQPSETAFFHRSGGDWFHVDAGALREAVEELEREGLPPNGAILLNRDASRLLHRLQNNSHVRWTDRSTPIAEKLAGNANAEPPRLPENLNGILRPYQKSGFAFLAERAASGIGAILADDMGLGKTLQILALLAAFRAQARQRQQPFHAMVVCPATVMDTWCQQARQFTPELQVALSRGTRLQRRRILGNGRDGSWPEVIVTHYGLLRADIDRLQERRYQFVILDEAQAIKNPHAQVTAAVRSLQADARLCLTGTPLENSLRDLWSILDFTVPGLCGTPDDFQNRFCLETGRRSLLHLLELLMLRRTKQLVAPELPPRTEENILLDMPEELELAYTRELARQKAFAFQGGYTNTLTALLEMRRFCCSPRLVHKPDLPEIKTDYLLERLQELLAGDHSVLVFSQFTSMLSLLQDSLTKENIPWYTITGDTPVTQRGEIVRQFNESPRPSVFLLSLKAAGTGLTLTRADYVFLFDPWWNPAVENQAIDRTHRLGQGKPVFAYRLLVKNTVEEKVLAIVQQKKELFDSVINQTDAATPQALSLDFLRSLLG